jgi:hypothetical protein
MLATEEEQRKKKEKEEQQKVVEAELKRKVDEEEEKERKRNFDEETNIPATPSVGIVDIPIQECTFLMEIPEFFFLFLAGARI